ncbi:DNA repair protein SWI5 homolog [Patiria miniata]|uniref:DNA repair protein SWI5 homolog n=1 Tax=Patiria miniata TaxID=46514 RepID=A0A913Z453_PATMI|nr:DNA repair protein SWI5 homolog [Patiria miniata]
MPKRNDKPIFPSRHSLSGSARKRLKHDNFKSPVRVQTDSSKPTESKENLTKEVENLQQSAEELQAEIASLTNEGYCEEELQTHIEKMHEYNELKDTGQMLLGKIALVEGVTTKDLYERFGLNLDD